MHLPEQEGTRTAAIEQTGRRVRCVLTSLPASVAFLSLGCFSGRRRVLVAPQTVVACSTEGTAHTPTQNCSPAALPVPTSVWYAGTHRASVIRARPRYNDLPASRQRWRVYPIARLARTTSHLLSVQSCVRSPACCPSAASAALSTAIPDPGVHASADGAQNSTWAGRAGRWLASGGVSCFTFISRPSPPRRTHRPSRAASTLTAARRPRFHPLD
jgi:hypothetical protein